MTWCIYATIDLLKVECRPWYWFFYFFLIVFDIRNVICCNEWLCPLNTIPFQCVLQKYLQKSQYASERQLMFKYSVLLGEKNNLPKNKNVFPQSVSIKTKFLNHLRSGKGSRLMFATDLRCSNSVLCRSATCEHSSLLLGCLIDWNPKYSPRAANNLSLAP